MWDLRFSQRWKRVLSIVNGDESFGETAHLRSEESFFSPFRSDIYVWLKRKQLYRIHKKFLGEIAISPIYYTSFDTKIMYNCISSSYNWKKSVFVVRPTASIKCIWGLTTWNILNLRIQMTYYDIDSKHIYVGAVVEFLSSFQTPP